MSRLVLDAGAFIALDRNSPPMWARLVAAQKAARPLITHGGVIGQVWRHPSRQARLAMVVRGVDIHPIDAELGRAAGVLLAASGTSDVNDAALAILCRSGDTVVTSDVRDIADLLSTRAMTDVDVVCV